MRKTFFIFALACAATYGGVATAAIPVRWSVDTFRVRPLVYDCYHGETLDLAADLSAYGEPVDLTGKTAKLYWQTNGMDEVWWVTNATVRAEGGVRNILAAEFSGAYDPGAPSITGFIGIEGENYRASFQLNLRHSPGFTPAELDLPAKEINCATTIFVNPDKAPWPIHACDTNNVNALIYSYDLTNLTLRFNGKLDLPPDLAPSNWIPVSVGHDREAIWMPNMGGGGGSLGSVNYITDTDGKCYPVYATTNAEGTVIQVVGQIPIAPMKKTVEQEEYRAVTKEQMLYTNLLAEAAIRLATDNDLYAKFNSLSALGRFISTWDCEAGRPGTEPLSEFIEYKGGDYYIVGKVATNATNFIPNGTIYYRHQQSTTPAPDDVYVNDIYRHTDDGNWVHTVMAGVMVRWEQIDGSPTNSLSYMNATTNIAFTITTQTVTKAYVEGLGIQSCDTNAVQYIIDNNIATNHVASYDLAQSKIAKPSDSVPAGYSLVKGITNLTEWVQLPATNIIGFLCYIRDDASNAYRVVAMKNPNDEIVAAIEQTPTPMEIITIDELRDAFYATNAIVRVALTNIAEAATNYTDLAAIAATNYANAVALAATNFTISATNALDASHKSQMSQLSQAATNYTDSATNAISAALLPLILDRATLAQLADAATASTNFTISATNALDLSHRSQLSHVSQAATNFTISATNTLDTALHAALAAEATARATADASLTAALKSDATAATNYTASAATAATNYTDAACAVINDRVTAEVTRATNAEAALQNAVNAEATSRLDGDTALQGAIEAEAARAVGAEDTLTGNLAAETTARADADTAIRASLASASTAATNYTDAAKSALNTALAAETTRATTAENALTSSISAEATARTTADNTLQNNITSEATARTDADTALRSAINSERAALVATSSALRASIAAEATARATADTTLNNALANEIIDRADEDTAIRTTLSAEVTRSTNADAAHDASIATLQGNITAEATARADADALLIPLEQKAAVNGVATLDGDRKIPMAQIPSLAINVQEYDTKEIQPGKSHFPIPGQTNTIYIAKDTNKTYRYSFTDGYIDITSSGATDYSALINKPKIGGVELSGDKSLADIGAQEKLPTVILDYYLHANHVTGELEWKGISGGDISNYNALANRPIINGNVVTGGINLASADLGLMSNLVVDATVANKVLKNDGSTIFWGEGGGGGGEDCIPITKTVNGSATIKSLFESAFGKSWDDIPQNSSMIVYATGLPYADNTFPNSEGYCILRYRTYRYAYIEFICPTVTKNGTKFNKMQNGTWKGWMDPPLPIFNINKPTSYIDLFNKMGYSYGMDGFTASGIATGLNIDPAKGDYFPHPNCYITVSTLNNACYRIQASGFNQIGVLWERREESGLWRPWTRIDGNVSQKTIWGDYNDKDSIFLEAFCATNSQPDKATITGYAYNLDTATFPEMTGFMTLRQVDSNNKQIEFHSTKPDTPVKYNTKTNGVWTGWKSADALQQTALILNGGPEQITGPMVVPNGYGTAGQVLVSNGSSTPPSWGDIFDIIYPVGSIYISVGSTLPTAFTQGGRTWEKLSDGQFLMNTTGTTGVSGGSNSRTLTTANMPAHSHGGNTLNPTASMYFGYGTYTCGPHTCYDGFTGLTTRTGRPNQYDGSNAAFDGVKTSFSGKWTGATTTVGSGTAFDNRPSYLSVSMWKRTN